MLWCPEDIINTRKKGAAFSTPLLVFSETTPNLEMEAYSHRKQDGINEVFAWSEKQKYCLRYAASAASRKGSRLAAQHRRRAVQRIQMPGVWSGKRGIWDPELRWPRTRPAHRGVLLPGTRHWLEAPQFSAVSFAGLEQHLLVGLRCVSLGLLGLMHEMGSVRRDPGLLFSRLRESGLLADSWREKQRMSGSQQTALLHERILARTSWTTLSFGVGNPRNHPCVVPTAGQPYEESGRLQSHKCHTPTNLQALLLCLMRLQTGGCCMIADCGPHQTTRITVLKSRRFVRSGMQSHAMHPPALVLWMLTSAVLVGHGQLPLVEMTSPLLSASLRVCPLCQGVGGGIRHASGGCCNQQVLTHYWLALFPEPQHCSCRFGVSPTAKRHLVCVMRAAFS